MEDASITKSPSIHDTHGRQRLTIQFIKEKQKLPPIVLSSGKHVVVRQFNGVVYNMLPPTYCKQGTFKQERFVKLFKVIPSLTQHKEGRLIQVCTVAPVHKVKLPANLKQGKSNVAVHILFTKRVPLTHVKQGSDKQVIPPFGLRHVPPT